MLIDPRPGEIFAEKYEITRVLGRGGMGLVVAARHVQLDEPVAIKLMLPAVAENRDAVVRFVREARAAAKIKNEHVVRVFDVGTLAGGQPYMVMECLEGADLGALLVERGRLPVVEVVEYVLQGLEAIAEAHALGIVHRDLKPSNLYLTRKRDGTPVVKVLDFGISKMSGSVLTESDAAITATSALMGSPLYMSPEQMTSARDVDARADIWALGVIIYELVSGQRPFQADTLPQLCALILESAPAPLSAHVPDVPQALETLVARCLARDPNARYANVAELAAALGPFAPPHARVSLDRILQILAPQGSHVPAWPAATLASPVPGGGTTATWGATAPPVTPPSSRRFVGIGLGTLVLGVLAGVIVLGRHGAAPTPPLASSNANGSASPPPSASALPSVATPPAASALPATPLTSASEAPSATPPVATSASTLPSVDEHPPSGANTGGKHPKQVNPSPTSTLGGRL